MKTYLSIFLLLLAVSLPAQVTTFPNTVKASNLWDISDVRYWGAIPNDGVDDWQAIQNAIGFASTNGGTVKLPSGTNLYGRTIFLKSNVRLIGEPGAILARVPGMHQSRPYDALSTNAGLFATISAVSRYYSTTGTYTNTATLVPNSSYVGPHSNIYVGNIIIYGAGKTNGNLHQIASGAPVLGDINDVDAISLDDCSNVLIENVIVPFASEHAVSVLGNTDVQEGGSGRNIRIVNLTAANVGMLIEAQENVQDLTAINPVGTEVYIHGMRMNGVRFSKVIGGSIGPCPTGNALYYAQTGTHLAFGVNLAKTNTAELTVRIDEGAENVTLIGNTIHQGQIGRSLGTSGVVFIQANRWLNNDNRSQSTNLSGFIHDSTGFIQLPETRMLMIDEILPTSTNSSTREHFIYSSVNNGITRPHNQSTTRFDNSVTVRTNAIGIGTDNPGNLLSLQKIGTDGTTPGIDFSSTLGSTSPNAPYSSGRIYTKFDGTSYSDARITFSYPDNVGTFQDGFSLKNGKVGIGTTVPFSALDVPGEVRIGTLIATNATFTNLNVTVINAATLNISNAPANWLVSNAVGNSSVIISAGAISTVTGSAGVKFRSYLAASAQEYPGEILVSPEVAAGGRSLMRFGTSLSGTLNYSMAINGDGYVGVGTTNPIGSFHVVGGIIQTNGGIWQHFSIGAPSAPAANTQGAVLWNDGTNWCSVFRNGAGTLSTNKFTMASWP